MIKEKISVASKALTRIDLSKECFLQGKGLGYLTKSRELVDMVGQLALDGAVAPNDIATTAIVKAKIYMAKGVAYFSPSEELGGPIRDMIFDLRENLGGGLIK